MRLIKLGLEERSMFWEYSVYFHTFFPLKTDETINEILEEIGIYSTRNFFVDYSIGSF